MAVVVGIVFTIMMAVLTYGFAVGWAALHQHPAPLPTAPSPSASTHK